jgi:hypothetical protein
VAFDLPKKRLDPGSLVAVRSLAFTGIDWPQVIRLQARLEYTSARRIIDLVHNIEIVPRTESCHTRDSS